MSAWLPSGNGKGTSTKLKFLKDEDAWQQLPPEPVTWSPPSVSTEQVTFDEHFPATISMPCRYNLFDRSTHAS